MGSARSRVRARCPDPREAVAVRDAAKPFDAKNLSTVAGALRRFLDALPPYRPPEEQVTLLEAGGRVLAREVRAEADVPAFARATMDGWAVRAADTSPVEPGVAPVLTVRGQVRMGEAPSVTVGPGEAVWIPTGGMLPGGADAVLPVESSEPAGGAGDGGLPAAVKVLAPVRPGENVLPAGADVAAGRVVLRSGHRLRPQDVGALAAVGCTAPWVFRRPVVAIISSGDELVSPDRQPGPGQIRDANAYSLANAVRNDGGVPRLMGIVPDDPERLRAAVEKALANDMVIISGGSSVGRDDMVADILSQLGLPGVLVHGVRMAPGKPTILALIGDRVVCGLPGNPVSALVTYELFVRPALRWRMGCVPLETWQPTVRARLGAPLTAPPGRELYARVRLVVAGGELVAQPVPGGSGQLSSLVQADGLVVVPLERGSLPAGEIVDVRLFG